MRRIISVIISVIFTLSSTACASAAETNKPQLIEENGIITVTNAVENGTLILAFYNTGALVGTDIRRGSGTITADISNAPERADRVKAFYWDMESIMPLGENVIDQSLNSEPTATPTAEPTPEPTPTPEPETENNIMVKIGDKEFSATLYDNKTAEAFKAMLPLSLNMSELNGNEKYYYLSDSLPTNMEKISTINAGDIMLYTSSCVVLFYETFNTSFSYTKIGRIDDVTGLKEAVGSGSVTITFE